MYRFHAPSLVKEVDVPSKSRASRSSNESNSINTYAPSKVIEVKSMFTSEKKTMEGLGSMTKQCFIFDKTEKKTPDLFLETCTADSLRQEEAKLTGAFIPQALKSRSGTGWKHAGLGSQY